MNTHQKACWDRLIQSHPLPWYNEQSNQKGVHVKDNHGDTVFYDDFGSIPDEMPSSISDQIRIGSYALSRWLIAMSEDPPTKRTTEPPWLSQALNEGDGTYKP